MTLVQGPVVERHSLGSTLHALLSTTALLLRLPFHLIYHFVLFRSTSPIVQELGRSPLAETAAVLVRHIFLHLGVAPGRALFSLGMGLPSSWVTRADAGGVKAYWVAPPSSGGSSKKSDDLVLYWIHGGAFTHDTAATCEPAFVALTKLLNARGVKFSIFHLDYSLAPEHIYPTQQRQILAGYRYLVDELGVPERRICIGGDSAGGNLVAGFLLHLARPSKRIQPPEDLRATPKQPSSALFVSPFIDLLSYNASRAPAYPVDFIDDGGVFHGSLRYVGAVEPYPPQLATWRRAPSWNPLRWIGNGTAADPPPRALVDLTVSAAQADEAVGLALLASPYVNPHVGTVKDLAWYKAALPGNGKTLVTWGGKEIFSDDIELWVDALKKAGVAPSELFKPLAVHDWPLFDAIVPTNSRDKNGGEQSRWDYGVGEIAKFLEARARKAKQA
ncbi:hypothetical protein JCM9279_007586 [Rhodotorula babjevae]